MPIVDVIRRARVEPTFKPTYLRLFTTYVCRVHNPVVWDRGEIEHELGLEIPQELDTLWGECGGMVLYEEAIHRQGGMVVLSPSEASIANRKYREEDERMIPGDLVFATFLGDLRLALIRSDKSAVDYGSIMIVAEMDPRSYWYTPAKTLEEFLQRFMDAHGDDYWDVHYEKILAARTPTER